MTGFLRGLVDRVQGQAQATLRRRRPSVFEARGAVASPLMALDAGEVVPASTPPGARTDYIVHRHDIHHYDRAEGKVAPRAHGDGKPATPVPAGVPAPQLSLPTPPSLRPPSIETGAAAIRHAVAPVALETHDPTPPMRRLRRMAGPAEPARSAAHVRQVAGAPEPPPLRRARPAPKGPSPAPSPAASLPLPPRLPPTQRAAAPVAHPARRAALPAPAVAPVHVTIGSVEIRANAPAPAPQRPPSRPVAGAAVPSLDAYLRQRHGGPR